MTRRALGRGLNALISDLPTTNEELREIDIDLIEPNPMQPRSRFDEAKLEELAQSIKSNGLVQPLLVRKSVNNSYQIIAGERRWRAAQRAGLQRLPAVVRDVPDEKMLELALIENIQRQELNAIEEAQAYKRLIENLGLTQETVAQRVGRDRTFVTNYLRLLRLPDDIQNLVEESKLAMGHARALLGIDDVVIQREVAKRTLEQGLSVREVERLIKRIIAGESTAETQAVNKEPEEANIRLAESKLRRRFGTQVRVLPNQSGPGGKIEIKYYTESDLQRIYELIISSESTE
ncbi:MAG: ParB/RepB/Spo0J family partition protein [Acidobacteriota bacterium]|jgi:ParB family chromosome partitioning protein|nr:ParB/RepB/Spo0J family partition protein [Acidobacteriota bacterium]